MENKILILFYYITYIYTPCYIHIYNNNNIRIYKMIVGERIIFAIQKRELKLFEKKINSEWVELGKDYKKLAYTFFVS